MSYAIVRVQKFTTGSVGGIQIHDKRLKEGKSHTNQDIDWERSHLNYDLAQNEKKSFHKTIKERIKKLQLKKAVRKDAVVMAQCLVTSDKDFFYNLPQEKIKEFFQESYNFLCERYGKENVVSSTVHMDETTPHMHFNFVPVTSDGRLSAKSVLTRQSIIEQHDLFFKDVGKKYGLERGKEGGNKKHLEVAEYKIKTKNDELKKTETLIEDAKIRLEDSLKMVSEAGKKVILSESLLAPLKAEYESKKAYLDEFEKGQHGKDLPVGAKLKTNLRGEEIITFPKNLWENFLEEIKAAISARRIFENSLSEFADSYSKDYIDKLETELIEKISLLEKKLQSSLRKEKEIKGKLELSQLENLKIKNNIDLVLKQFPDEVSKNFHELWEKLDNGIRKIR